MGVDIDSDIESYADSCASSDMVLDDDEDVNEREVAQLKGKARGTTKKAATKSKTVKKIHKADDPYDNAAVEPADVRTPCII